MTSAEAVSLQVTWKQQVGRPRCMHLNQEVQRSEDGIVTATYHCLACGEAVLRIY
jgi:hypothetical protein